MLSPLRGLKGLRVTWGKFRIHNKSEREIGERCRYAMRSESDLSRVTTGATAQQREQT